MGRSTTSTLLPLLLPLLLLPLLCRLPVAAAPQPSTPPPPAYVCLAGGDPSCSLSSGSVQCVEYAVDRCIPSGFGTYIVVTRNGSHSDPGTPVSQLDYALTSFADAGCTASLGPSFDTGRRSGEACFFLGTESAPLGFIAFHEPRSCRGLCGDADAGVAYACLHGGDGACGLTATTTCLAYPLSTCTPSGLGTYVRVTRSGVPYANGTAYELTSYADPACAVSIDPGFDTGEREEGECFFLGTAQSPVGYVAFREPSSCLGRCIPPEPTSAFTCLFGTDDTCTLADTVTCLEFPLQTCTLTDFGTYVYVSRNGSSIDANTLYSLDSFADANCTAALDPVFDTGPRERGECVSLGPLGYVAFHEPATCEGHCDAAEEETPCNPTECSTGLQCVNNPGVCGPLNDWSFCGTDESGDKFSNRLYCPPGWVQCADNFCAATEDVCLTKGGTKYSPTTCAANDVIMCDFPLNSGCVFDSQHTRCRRVASTSCNQFYPYFMLLSESGSGDNATFAMQPFSALGCGLDLFNDPTLGPRDMQLNQCVSVALPNFAPQQQYDVLVMPLEACPDCPEQFPGPPVNTTFNPSCASKVSRSACEADNARCTWVGVSWAGCTDPLEAVNVLSAPVSCSVLRLNQEACENFPGNCVYDQSTGVCEVRDLTDDERTRLVRSVIWLSFDSEIQQEAPDAPLTPFIDLGDFRYQAVPKRMLGGSRVSGVRGRGLRLHSWEYIEFPGLPTLPTAGWLSNLQLWVLPDPTIQLNVVAGPRSEVLGPQNFLFWPSEAAIAALPAGDAFVLASFGRNGLLIVDWDPAADTIVPVASLELDLGVWSALTIFFVTDNTLLVVYNGAAALQSSLPAGRRHLATQRLFYAPSEADAFRGLVDELNTQTVDYAQWAPPTSQLPLTTTYHASFSAELLCALRYRPADGSGAFRAVAGSPFVLGPAAVTSLDPSVSADQPLHFSLDAAVPGLSVNSSTGIVSGVVPQPGRYLLEVAVSGVEDRLCSGFFATELQVLPELAFHLADGQDRTLLATAGSFRRFELALNVTGGAGDYTFSARGGPDGLFVQPSDGVLTLASVEAGSFATRLVVRDALGSVAELGEDILLRVAPALSLAPLSFTATCGAPLLLPPPVVNGGIVANMSSYSYALSEVAVDGQAFPTADGIPGNLTLDTVTGIIQGVPLEPATVELGYEIIDAVEAAFAYRLSLTIYPRLTLSFSAGRARRDAGDNTTAATTTAAPTAPAAPLPSQSVAVLEPVEETGAVTVGGGLAPYAFSLVNAPLGLGVDSAGRISGRPADVGDFVVTLRVRDSNGAVASMPVLRLAVAPRPTASGDSGLTSGQRAGIIVPVIFTCFVVALLAVAYLRRKKKDAYDFSADIEELLEQRVLGDNIEVRDIKVPRELPRENIRMVETIGSGNFGEVWRARLDEKLRNILPYTVAAKVNKSTGDPQKRLAARHALLVEALIMQQFEHENVLRLVGVVTRTEPAMVVVPICEHGSLYNFLLERTGFTQLVVASRLHIALDIAKGAEYLHRRNFVHRDLAARNVLIDATYTCQISDFGMARGLESGEYQGGNGPRPIRWLSNEALDYYKYTEASDVWAFGVTLHEIFTNAERPYKHMATNEEVMAYIRDPDLNATLSKPALCPQDVFTEAMVPCWHKDASKRPSFELLVEILEGLRDIHEVGDGSETGALAHPMDGPADGADAGHDQDGDAGAQAAPPSNAPAVSSGHSDAGAAQEVVSPPSGTGATRTSQSTSSGGMCPVSAYTPSDESAPPATDAYRDHGRPRNWKNRSPHAPAPSTAGGAVGPAARSSILTARSGGTGSAIEDKGQNVGFLRYAAFSVGMRGNDYSTDQRLRMVEQEADEMGPDKEEDYQMTREELEHMQHRRQAIADGLPDPGEFVRPSSAPRESIAPVYEVSSHELENGGGRGGGIRLRGRDRLRGAGGRFRGRGRGRGRVRGGDGRLGGRQLGGRDRLRGAGGRFRGRGRVRGGSRQPRGRQPRGRQLRGRQLRGRQLRGRDRLRGAGGRPASGHASRAPGAQQYWRCRRQCTESLPLPLQRRRWREGRPRTSAGAAALPCGRARLLPRGGCPLFWGG
ncbi:MAG: hypothetical protein CML43_14650 [Rhodobacteraceae bacterium]|nr:hypothetical protein [Paracoccaceae bacterium]